ncbi:MAG: hypothetical protein ACOY3D_05105 [Candidatus Omnitrophota bacterium]
MLWFLVSLAVIVAIFGIRIVSQWQVGVVLRLGKFIRQIKPGLQYHHPAKIIAESPNALILRQLQTWQEIGAEQNSLIILVPTEFAQIVKSLQANK